MTTQVDIGNNVLSMLAHAATITELVPPDNTLEARTIARQLPYSIQSVLEMYNWNFASRNVEGEAVAVAIASIDTAGNNIITATAHGLGANDRVHIECVQSGGSLPAPLEADTDYFVIENASTTLRLTDEEDGDAIDITTDGNGTFRLRKQSDRADWLYAYAAPTDCVKVNFVVPRGMKLGSFRLPIPRPATGAFTGGYAASLARDVPTGMRLDFPPFVYETNRADERVIYTDQPQPAILHYTWLQTDLAAWSPLALDCLTAHCAWKVAGSIVKGQEGREAAASCRNELAAHLQLAATSDANQRNVPVDNIPQWDAVR